MFGQYGFSEAARNGWALLWTKILYPGARLVRRPLYLRGGRRMMEFGPGLTTGYSCRIEMHGDAPTLHIGRNCKMNDRVHISAWESVTIGDDVLMGSNILITDNNHGSYGANPSDPSVAPDDRDVVTVPVRIGDRVWIGEGACVLPGVTVGDGAVISAGAVVTKDVPTNEIWGVCPLGASRHGTRSGAYGHRHCIYDVAGSSGLGR